MPSWTSILASSTVAHLLRERGQEHHCVSSIVALFAQQVTAAVTPPPHPRRTLEVLWVSQRRYPSYDGSHVVVSDVSQDVRKEEELVLTLRQRVAPHNMSLSLVDPAGLTLRTTLRLVRTADIMIGVHGAGALAARDC